jgi:energy-coupling factor transporter ATP-binding protein EcfA2
MKINNIHISNYRAFLVNGDKEIARYTIDLPNGENLLIYGENGSGKSSLFKALKDFFISASNPRQIFQKNLFYDESKNSEQPFIQIIFDDDSQHRFSADGNQYIVVKDESGVEKTNYIQQANVTQGFISYRDLLKLHFRQDDKDPDLFSLFLGSKGLFSDMIVPTPTYPANKISFNDLLNKAQEKLDENALSDYNINVAGLFQTLEDRANILLKYFEKKCKLRVIYIEGQINDGILSYPKISFKVTLFEREISGHDDVLNEARLTAIAISVYLAYVLSLPVTNLRILFLDDIFIGLDMSNRIPLIKILTDSDLGDGASFHDFQIFLTTYDREWFNVAKTYLNVGWQKAEFYVDNHSSVNERPLIRKSDTYEERATFHLIHGDYPACANYLRKAFEQALRNIIPENILYAGLDSSNIEASQVVVSKHQLSIKEVDDAWLFLPKISTGVASLSPRPAGLHTLIDVFKTLMNNYDITFPYLDEVIKIKTRLLNPLSHDDLRSPIFKKELEKGFLILEELQKVNSKILISISNENPLFLFFDKEDVVGSEYSYKFQLLENLRYLEYDGTERLLKTECKPISRTLKSTNTEDEQGLGKNQKSLYDLCKGICIFSAAKEEKRTVTLEESTLLNLVYTETGQKLKDLI